MLDRHCWVLWKGLPRILNVMFPSPPCIVCDRQQMASVRAFVERMVRPWWGLLGILQGNTNIMHTVSKGVKCITKGQSTDEWPLKNSMLCRMTEGFWFSLILGELRHTHTHTNTLSYRGWNTQLSYKMYPRLYLNSVLLFNHILVHYYLCHSCCGLVVFVFH